MHTIDTHSHFNLEPFFETGEYKNAITRMETAGVGTICVGTNGETSENAVLIARQSKSVWAIVGHHPIEWKTYFDKEILQRLITDETVVAIGECGLDYFRTPEQTDEAKEIQRAIFIEQIRLAREYDLPLMLHIRPSVGTMDAYEDALSILEEEQKEWGSMRGTSHFFAGTKEVADRFLALGFHISFSGVITFAKEYEDIVRHVPLDRILSETDAPFAAPVPHRGKTNEPAFVVEVVSTIARIKDVPRDTAEKQLYQNAVELFGLSK